MLEKKEIAAESMPDGRTVRQHRSFVDVWLGVDSVTTLLPR